MTLTGCSPSSPTPKLDQLVRIKDAAKRRFCEDHSLQGMWSVRELSRPIASIYSERTALSKDEV